MGRWTATLTVASIALGCGRVSFDSHGDARSGDVDPDAPPGPFCDPLTVTLCSDFTNGSAGFSSDLQTNGSYAFDPTGGPAPSGALIVSTVVAASPAQVRLLYGHVAPTTSLVYSFDVRIDVAGVGTPALGLATFDGATSSHGVEYVYDPTGVMTNLEEIIDPDVGSIMFSNVPVAGFPEHEWRRISVRLDIGSPWTATVDVEGAPQSQHALTDATNGTLAFSIGAVYQGDTSAPWVIRFSNVVVDVQ